MRNGYLIGLLALGLFVACGDKDGTGDGGAQDGGTEDGGADGGTDGGGDGGTDGGGGDGGTDGGGGDGGTDGGGGDGGTVEPDERDGVYGGNAVLRVIEPGGELIDTCNGNISINVVVNAPEPMRGNGTCRFSGDLAATWPDPVLFILDGSVQEDNRAQGRITAAFTKTTNVEMSWVGGFDPEGKLTGNFGRVTTIGSTEYELSGDFRTEPPPDKTE